MSELAHGLTEPLHYLPPFPWLRWAVVALVALFAALLWWSSRRRREEPRIATPEPPRPSSRRSKALDELERLREQHLREESYRRGCHELSGLLRTQFERRRRRPYSRWTAREARRADGDTVRTRLLSLLAELQFARRPPRRSDFEGICDLARDTLTSGDRT